MAIIISIIFAGIGFLCVALICTTMIHIDKMRIEAVERGNKILEKSQQDLEKMRYESTAEMLSNFIKNNTED